MVLLQALLEAGGWHVRAAVRGARLRMTVDAARPAGWSLAYLRLAVRVVLVWCRARGQVVAVVWWQGRMEDASK